MMSPQRQTPMQHTKPNILLIMADQLAVAALPFHGHPLVQAPNLSRLARDGVVFDSAYCNFPICAPSRFSLLSGRLPHSIGAYDNASEFPAAMPTMAHYLRHAGYRTILCGKMHFIGPDQLHGFEERLTTDIYPADFAWTPDWLKGPAYRPTGVRTCSGDARRPEAQAAYSGALDGDGVCYKCVCVPPADTHTLTTQQLLQSFADTQSALD